MDNVSEGQVGMPKTDLDTCEADGCEQNSIKGGHYCFEDAEKEYGEYKLQRKQGCYSWHDADTDKRFNTPEEVEKWWDLIRNFKSYKRVSDEEDELARWKNESSMSTAMFRLVPMEGEE